MRRIALLLCACALLTAGCKRRHHPNPAATIEEEGELASAISVADPKDASQLLSGFHTVESDSWRWSMKKFAVSLAPPLGAPQKGATLVLNFALPDAVAAKLLGLSITPTVAGQRIAPCQVTKPGEQACQFDVPPNALKTGAVVVEFELSKAIEPGDGDSRQLGLVVARIGFTAK
ncbi:MAG TPA: hypothetical protein VGK29_05155 [Paludibaculum sp.]|jgi:hypothetical protein